MKKKMRRKFYKERRRPNDGFICNCYYCLKIIERKRANSLSPQRKASHVKSEDVRDL